MRKQQTIKGWVGRSDLPLGIGAVSDGWHESVRDRDGGLLFISETKGRRAEWEENDWPPVKVTIIVEGEG